MRKWRFLAMTGVLLLFAACYFAAGGGLADARRAVLEWQFTPALAYWGASAALVAAGIAVMALVAGSGRVYCSFLCPAGIVQELFHRVGGLLGTRRLRFVPASSRIALLALVGLSAAFGLFALANILDPVGLFGRLAVPAANLWNRLVMGRGELYGHGGGVLAFMALGAVALVVVPLFRGRWFCDRLCPVGALLGTVSAGFPGRMGIDAERCVSCGACARKCPMRCIDAENRKIDPARCVLCLECGPSCPKGAIGRVKDGPRKPANRREFLGMFGSYAAAALFLSSRRWSPERVAGSPARPLPPGFRSAADFRRRCISCQSCVAACPVGMLRPEAPHLAPGMDFDTGFCQYDCVLCSRACPTGALRPLTVEEKRIARIARMTLFPDRCVVTTQGTSCGACAEVCPTHALLMVSQGGDKPTIPAFSKDYCIGCGACYHVCPAAPRAFAVEAVLLHEEALPAFPAEEKGAPGGIEAPPGEMQDFPF